jgi:hypothetical protein
MNWKVVSSGKMTTQLRKATQHEHGDTSKSLGDAIRRKNGSDNDDAGFKAKVMSGTVCGSQVHD